MLSKIFSFSSRKADKKAPANEIETHLLSNDIGFYPDLEASQIRVLIFKDSDGKGKKLLHDTKVSSKFEKSQNTPLNKNQEKPKKLSCGKGECPSKNASPGRRSSPMRRPSSDSTMLGEMIFGSVAMTYKGSTVKVHVIRSPHQLLLTKVFSLKPVLPVSSCYSEDSESLAFSQVDSLLDSSGYEQDSSSLSSQNNSPKDVQSKGGSIPVAVPGANISIEPEDDSGFTASLDSLYLNSCSGSMTSLCNLASSPCGNFQRRLHRSQIKSIEKHRKTECGLEEPNSPILRRQPKIGIGVLLPLEGDEEKSNALQAFFFAHFPLFDSHVHRLRCAIEKAICSRNSFSAQIIEAIDKFSEDVCNLLKTPRLREPVWLHMMTFPDDRRVQCEQFMEQFTTILKLYNNRETGFFLSSLLSAVLTHHLAWVPTVMPAGAAPNRAYLDKHSSQTLDLLAQSHPYNPLWAQLSDLYGAIGFPLKLARTVVIGKNSKLVGQLLSLISYFIRCTEVVDHNLQRDESKNGNLMRTAETEICCLCSDQKDVFSELDLYHKHNICESCMEQSGLSICVNCQKLTPKELTNITMSLDKSSNLPKKLLEGLPCCDKCGLLQKQSNVNGLFRLNTVSGSCSCLPKWAVAKDLQHFLVDLTFSERSETFKCYCCEVEPIQDKNSEGKPTFQCYCVGDNKCNHCNNRINGYSCNARTDCTNLGRNLENTFMELLAHDQFCTKLECSCDRKDDIDIDCCENVEKNSHGRTGSLDSGFDQNSSSSCIKNKEEVECLSIDTLEDDDDDDCGPEELPLLGIVSDQDEDSANRSDKWRKSKNFGRTLFSGVSETYHPDFVLQGVTCNKENLLPDLSSDLLLALQHSVIDDVLSDAICIIADTDNWTCELISAKKAKGKSQRESLQTQPVEVSNLVLSMLSSVTGLWDINMPAEFCLMHLEDSLKEIYLKSRVIAEWLRNSKKAITTNELARTLGIDDSDMMLLLAVASSHSPQGMANLR